MVSSVYVEQLLLKKQCIYCITSFTHVVAYQCSFALHYKDSKRSNLWIGDSLARWFHLARCRRISFLIWGQGLTGWSEIGWRKEVLDWWTGTRSRSVESRHQHPSRYSTRMGWWISKARGRNVQSEFGLSTCWDTSKELFDSMSNREC